MRLGFIIGIVLLCGATAAPAQEWPRINIFAGGQIADFSTDVTLAASTTVFGTNIDFERDLGFKENSGLVWASGLWRISRRNQITVMWNTVSRDVIDRQLQQT